VGEGQRHTDGRGRRRCSRGRTEWQSGGGGGPDGQSPKAKDAKGLGIQGPRWGGSLQPEFFRKALRAAACMQTQIAEELAAACRDDDWAWLQSVRLPVSQRESGCKAVLNF
jgi:hypothetical protein